MIGPARDGRPLEIVVLDPEGLDPEGGGPTIIHASVLRPSLFRYLQK